jgi:hypothetical protein
MILDIQAKVDWKMIHDKKKKQAEKVNAQVNKSRIPHEYAPNDLILINLERKSKSKLATPTEGPYKILQVFNNGTVRIQRKSYEETINIRRIKPYKERPSSPHGEE